jgi:hypothetical protein
MKRVKKVNICSDLLVLNSRVCYLRDYNYTTYISVLLLCLKYI